MHDDNPALGEGEIARLYQRIYIILPPLTTLPSCAISDFLRYFWPLARTQDTDTLDQLLVLLLTPKFPRLFGVLHLFLLVCLHYVRKFK